MLSRRHALPSLPVATVPDSYTPEGVLAKIDSVAAALGVAAAGEALRAKVASELAAVEQAFGAVTDRPRVLFLLTVSKSRTAVAARSEEHTSELQSLMRISSAVFCLKKKTHKRD